MQNPREIYGNVPTYSPHIPHIYPTDSPHIFKCEYCDQIYKTQKSKSRHTNSCLKKKLIDINLNNAKLLEENIILKKKIEELENKINKYEESNQKSIENITKLALTSSQKGNTNINSSYQIIINQFKDAPNLTLPKDLLIQESLDKYIESGNPHGIINFLDKYYGSKIPPQSRSLWCIDATRCKFVLRHNNEWLIDLDGNKFRELTFYPLQDMFYENQKNTKDNSKLITNMEFLEDL